MARKKSYRKWGKLLKQIHKGFDEPFEIKRLIERFEKEKATSELVEGENEKKLVELITKLQELSLKKVVELQKLKYMIIMKNLKERGILDEVLKGWR